MKLNTVICLIAFSSITLSTNIQAQITFPKNLKVNPETIERGKGIARGIAKVVGKQAAIETGKRVAPGLIVPLALKPKRTIVAGAIIGGGAYWWYTTTMPATVKRMAKNPDDFEIYWEDLGDNYDKKLDFAQTTWENFKLN